MREILFRGKRIDNGEWVSSGNLITFNDKGEGKQFFIPQMNAKCTCTHDEQDNILSFDSGVFYKVDPKTIGQYTGRKDKNNKKVFEGDILRVTVDGQNWGVGVVQWCDHDQCFSLFLLPNSNLRLIDFGDLGLPEYYEIIGNIHDNPELLEVTADG